MEPRSLPVTHAQNKRDMASVEKARGGTDKLCYISCIDTHKTVSSRSSICSPAVRSLHSSRQARFSFNSPFDCS